MSIINLEPICAACGRDLITNSSNSLNASDRENVITKALNVLVENGLYAMALFLLSCKQKIYGMMVLKRLAQLLAHDSIALMTRFNGQDATEIPTLIDEQILQRSLQKVFLARRLTEQALVFARYTAKAQKSAPRRGADQ